MRLLARHPGANQLLRRQLRRQHDLVNLADPAVAPAPAGVRRPEALLGGKQLTAGATDGAAERAALSAKPISDMRGSAEYRIEMVKALTRKTLRHCAETLGVDIREAA